MTGRKRHAPGLLQASAPLLLTIGFYGLVTLLVLGLVTLPFVAMTTAEDSSILRRLARWLGDWCFPLAAAVAVASWPRRDRFRPRGVRVREQTQGRLFAVIRSIAEQAGEKPPGQVYLTNEVNAAVADTNGFLGPGRVRILSIGLPLLQVLTMAQARAVLAHEFGHFAHGHTRFGAWTWRQRAAIARVASAVGAKIAAFGILFQAYARLFLRVSRTMARHQEVEADAFAARLAGGRELAVALRKVGPAAAALDQYLEEEYLPVVAAHRSPPFLSGFRTFLAAAAAAGRSWSTAAVHSRTVDPYDTHPPLAERLERLGESAPVADPRDESELAIGWIADLHNVELDVVRAGLRMGLSHTQPVDWPDVGEAVIAPRLHAARQRLDMAGLQGIRVGDLVSLAPRLAEIGRELAADTDGPEPILDDRASVAFAKAALVEGVLGTLAAAGWRIVRQVGVATVATKGGVVLEPHRAFTGAGSARRWRDACAAAGVEGLELLPPAAAPSAVEPTALPEQVVTTRSPGPTRRRTARRRHPRRRSAGRLRLVLGLLLLIAALVLWLASDATTPDMDGWRREAAAFCTAWNAGDQSSVEAFFERTSHDKNVSWLRMAIQHLGWHANPPVLAVPESEFVAERTIRADFALPNGAMKTHWIFEQGHWRIRVIVLPTRR